MTNTNDLSRTLPNTNSVPKWLAEAVNRAQKLADEFAPLCVKLRALKPQIEEVQADFKKLKGSQTILGCRSFKDFCEKKLDRTEQAVYAMLGDYSKKQKSKKDGDGSTPQKPTLHQSLNLSDEDLERMRTGLNAVARARASEAVGDKAKADEAWQEYEAISQAESLKSTISGDLPNYKLLLVQLLGVIEKVGEKVPMTLITHVRAIRKRIGIDDASFGLQSNDRQPPQSAPPDRKPPQRHTGRHAGREGSFHRFVWRLLDPNGKARAGSNCSGLKVTLNSGSRRPLPTTLSRETLCQTRRKIKH